jgi:ERCC4-related helicase
MIQGFEPRLYQQTILGTCVENNTLVVLPTGMGKTNIFLMLATQRLKQYPSSKILFIGPTRPLIDQYMAVFRQYFEIAEEEMAVFTGMVKPEKREELWKGSRIVFSTPQGLENDIITKRIDLSEVSLLGIDEAHRAVGDYAYVFVARHYVQTARHPRILALTASPGSDMEKIQEVCDNLHIEAIEVRTPEDQDVRPYIKDIAIEWVYVNLPPAFIKAQYHLQGFLKDRMKRLKKWGVLRRTDISFVNKTDLLQLQAQLRGRVASGGKDFVIWNAISVLAEIMKISHGLELLETQGVSATHSYLHRLQAQSATTKVKAVQNIVKDPDFKSALMLVRRLQDEGMQHPKLVEILRAVEKEVKKNADVKILIFNQYRDNAVEVNKELKKIEGVRSEIFVGQMKKGETGLSQREQKEILAKFREGELNVLVATSVGEEGLDVPRVDLVVFYEPIPSAIRHIQRRGRTGRQEQGRVMVFIAKNTRDEGYRWSAHHKEKRMHRNLEKLRSKIKLKSPQESLQRFVEDKPRVFADYREKGSGVVKELLSSADVKLQQLAVADYVVSSRAGIELKTVEDFVNSIIDGRLLQQLKELKRQFERPLLIIEGTNDIYSVRNVHANSIRGMLATVAVSYGLPMLYSKNAKETAALITVIAKREQDESGTDFQPHASKRAMTLKEQQEYVVSSLPGVGISLARPLLKWFRTIKRLINAEEQELQKVPKIGPQKAQAIKGVVEREYDD